MDVERIEPEGEDSCFSFSFGVERLDFWRRFGGGEGFETGMSVEEIRDEGEVEFGVSFHEGSGSEIFSTA